jgi:hypothetical protein
MDSVKLTLEVPITVCFDFQPREPATRHCPGCEAQDSDDITTFNIAFPVPYT